MGRLKYMLSRALKMDWKRMWQTAGALRAEAGKSRLWLLYDMARCALRYNAGYVDYKIAKMYRLSAAQRKTVITRGVSNSIVRRMNDKKDWHFFDDKAEFNETFREQVDRAWLRVDETLSQEALSAFLKDRDRAIFKPLEGSSGQGISLHTREDWKEPAAFLQELKDAGPGVLEEVVVQHEKMASLCPTSVNTVRIATLLGDKKQGVVYAFLRIGNGRVMDNVDCGGMAARVDLESGKLLTVAADKQGNVFSKHPMTGTPIVGFEIPYFKEAMDMCLAAMRRVPGVRFVAWDVAITPDGPRFIEGNSFPSHAIPQFAAHYPDGVGILPEFEKFIDL